jgi:hypothetical protein
VRAPHAARARRLAREPAQVRVALARPGREQRDGALDLVRDSRAHGEPGELTHAEVRVRGERAHARELLFERDAALGRERVRAPAAHGVGAMRREFLEALRARGPGP